MQGTPLPRGPWGLETHSLEPSVMYICSASHYDDFSKVDSTFLIPNETFSVSNSLVILEITASKYSWTFFSLLIQFMVSAI